MEGGTSFHDVLRRINAISARRNALAGTGGAENIREAFVNAEHGQARANTERLTSGLSAAILGSDAIPQGLAQGEQILADRGRLPAGVEAGLQDTAAEQGQISMQNIREMLRGRGLAQGNKTPGSQAVMQANKRATRGRSAALGRALDKTASQRQREDVGPSGILNSVFLNPAQSLIAGEAQRKAAEEARPDEPSDFERGLGFALSGASTAATAGLF